MKKLSDYVVEFVVRMGIKHVFMLTGGACMHLVDSVGRNQEIEYVCCLHEQACTFAAEAYAEYKSGDGESSHASGNHGLGVVLVTAGPGGTNTLTGVAAAWLESASVLVISGQAKRADLIGNTGVRSMGQQELDIVSVVRPITKYAVTVMEPDTIRFHLEKAVHLATHGRRGPVWIDLPLDVQAAMIEEAALPGFHPSSVTASVPLEPLVSAAIDLLNQAERPVLFLGNGVRGAHRSGLLGKLIQTLHIPVLLTWKAADVLPDSDEFYCGRPGSIGQRGANFTQQNSDCLMILGARLDLPQTAFNHRNFARAAKKIMVDIDPAELDKMQTRLDVRVCEDAAEFISEFLLQAGDGRLASRLDSKDRSGWLRRCKEWSAKYPVVLPEYWVAAEDPASGAAPSDQAVNAYVLMDVLSSEVRATDILVPGSSGPCSDIFMQAFRVKRGQRIVNAPGLGAMGTGLAATIGGCLASGRKRTICVNGDGGFQLNIQELETVRRLNLPIKFFVLCNGGYASIMATQRNYFQGRYVGSDPSGQLTLPSVIKVAEAYGITTARIASHRDLAASVRKVLDHDGPIVCAVDVPPDQPTAPRVSSFIRPDGRIASKPMEDMWPFLSREEFLANMIVPPFEDE